MNQWRFQLNLERGALPEIREWLGRVLERQDLEEVLPFLVTAVDEACTNIFEHAYIGRRVKPVEIILYRERDRVTVEVVDCGVKHKWRPPVKPDWDRQASTGRKRGLGRYLIQKCLDGVRLEHTSDGRNRLFLTRKAPAVPGTRFGLRGHFTLLISLLVAFSVVATSLFLIFRSRDELAEEARRRAKVVARNFAANIRDALIKEELPALKYMMRRTMENEGVEYLLVVDRRGALRLHSDSEIEDRYWNKPYIMPGGLQGDTGGKLVMSSYRQDGKRMLDVAAPVELGEGYYGTIHLGMNEEIVAAHVRHNMRIAVAIMVVFLAMGLLSSILLASYIVKPIQRLARGARIIGGGDLDHRIEIRGRGEIGELSARISEMTRNLKRAQEDRIEKERFDKELQVAREIQRLLLPHEAPRFRHYDVASYYLAAREVGGDYYDYFRLKDGKIGVVVADVAGKGVPASLMMSMMKGYLREEASRADRPAELLKKVNDLISGDIKDGMFITSLCLGLSLAGRQAIVSNAGHCPLLHYRGQSGKIEEHNPPGFPLGLGEGGKFHEKLREKHIPLRPGDMLLLYTDGLSEARDGQGGEFGEERVKKVLREEGKKDAEKVIAALQREVVKFVGSDALADDITLVAIKVK